MSNEMDDVKEFLEYYAKRDKKTNAIEPNPFLDKRVYQIMARIPKDQRERVIRWVTDHHERNFGLDIKVLNTALGEIGVDGGAAYFPAEQWLCDACGLEFQYALVVTYAMKHDKGIFDTCPLCGMSPEDTMHARRIAEFQDGRFLSSYGDWKQLFLDGIERRKKLYAKTYETIEEGKRVVKEDPYYYWIFSRDQEDAFEKVQLYRTAERMKRESADELERITKKRSVKA